MNSENVCKSCRFGYPDRDDTWYCEIEGDLDAPKQQCYKWTCKLGKIGTPEEFAHSLNRWSAF